MKVVKDVMTDISGDEDRRSAIAHEIAAHTIRYKQLEADKKERTKDLTTKMKTERAEWEKKAEALRTGKLEETVECEEVQDFDRNEVRVVRCDNGAIVATRAMTGDERQTKIDMPEVEAAAGGKKKRLKAGEVTDASDPKKAH